MLEIIGFLVWVVFTIALTLMPFAIIGLSGLAGGLSAGDRVFILLVWALAAYSWYHILGSVAITLNPS